MSPRRRSSARAITCLFLCAFVGTCSCRQATRSASTLPAPVPESGSPTRKLQPPGEPIAAGGPEVRVAVLKDAPAVRITGKNATAKGASGLERRLVEGAALELSAGQGVLLDGVPEREVTIVSASPDERLSVNGQELAPRLRVTRSASGKGLTVVACIGMEEYLAGVLAGEGPVDKGHPEALKAQAITSRSYALYQTRKNAGESYDVESTVMSQVFRGGFRSHPALSAAINGTRGLVLTAGGEVFPAYFHSTCGGHTDSSVTVFPDLPATRPLGGAHCPYCVQSPHYRWKWLLNKAALAEKLRANPPAAVAPVSLPARVGSISSIEFLDAAGAPIAAPRGVPVRAASVRIRHSGGVLQMQGNAFRLLVSPRDLKSLLIEQAIDRGDAVEIAGGGFGHGVGLCQFGSQGMAQAGQPYATILANYYPGAALARMW